MDALAELAFVFLAGLTGFGLAGSLIELATRRPLRLGGPLLVRDSPLRALALTFAAGPFMLLGEALEVRRAGMAGHLAIAAAALVASGWTFAGGILIVALARHAIGLLV